MGWISSDVILRRLSEFWANIDVDLTSQSGMSRPSLRTMGHHESVEFKVCRPADPWPKQTMTKNSDRVSDKKLQSNGMGMLFGEQAHLQCYEEVSFSYQINHLKHPLLVKLESLLSLLQRNG